MKRGIRNTAILLLVFLVVINCNLGNSKNNDPRTEGFITADDGYPSPHSNWAFAEGMSFSGGKNIYGPGTGDNRGRYEYVDGIARFATSPAVYRGIGSKPLILENMDISITFGAVSGNTIPVTIRQISLKTEFLSDYEADGGNTVYRLSSVPDQTWSGNGVITENRIDLKIRNSDHTVITDFRIVFFSESVLTFSYRFNTGNLLAGYGIVIRNSDPDRKNNSSLINELSPADSFDLDALMPKNIPVSGIPDLDWTEFYGTIKADSSAFSFKSGKWDGVIQIDFIEPYSYAEHPVSMVIIDDSGIAAEKRICNFNDPDGTNDYYYSWGANIQFPEADKRYFVVFRNFTGKNIRFKAKSW